MIQIISFIVGRFNVSGKSFIIKHHIKTKSHVCVQKKMREGYETKQKKNPERHTKKLNFNDKTI